MAYIDRDDAIRTAIEEHIKAVGHGISHVEAVEIAEAMKNIPTVDIVEVKAIEQLKWERDTAIKQLQSYGVGLGENKELAEVKHGYWIPHKPMVRDPYARNYDCSECGNSPIECGEYCNKCGVKMDGEEKVLNNTGHSVDIYKMVSGWISVKDHLPNNHEWVLVACMDVLTGDYGVLHIAELRTGIWWTDCYVVPLENAGVEVTHWMPLPAPPEKGA